MSRGFAYIDATGKKITDEAILERLKLLVIPPAWKFVRISPAASGKLQAVGVDGRGRIQYLYHPKFSASQQQKKFAKIERFGEFMPRLEEGDILLSPETEGEVLLRIECNHAEKTGELEVLRLVAQGFSNTAISEKLFLSLSTVKGHNLRIFNKLQAKSRTEAVARARELGLL